MFLFLIEHRLSEKFFTAGIKIFQVVLPFGLQREVHAHLERYISRKSVNKEYFLDTTLSRSSSFCSIDTGGGVHEQKETLIKRSIAAEKILRPKSLQLRNKQQDWQVISA